MAYDFTSIIDRSGKDALAFEFEKAQEMGSFGTHGVQVKPGFDIIPMWVADMNFATAPHITESLRSRIDHPLFGYFIAPDEYYDSIIRWHAERKGVVDIEPKHIGYENGVLGGVVSTLNVACSRGDAVLLHSPTYVGFSHVLHDNGYEPVLSPLERDAQGVWRMNFDDMEKKIVEKHIHAAVFCSPHNPTGRVWERRELEAAAALFQKHDVTVICDEIWSDILLDGAQHIPFQSISDDARNRTVALYAPSKTFNIAGLVGSYHIIYNDRLRSRVRKEGALSHYNSMNVLSMRALVGAYDPESYAWVDDLNAVLSDNASYACSFIEERFEGVSCSRPQGTYMLFIDCAEWCEAHGKAHTELMAMGLEHGVLWQDGAAFNGPTCIRMNLALPKSRLEEAFKRLDRYVFNA